MPLPAYRVKQSTDTTGTGTLVLNAASATARSFQQAYGTGARRVLYVISWATGYEIGLGDFDGGSPGSLTRATVLASSNSNALVSLPAGTKDVFIALLPGQREPRTFSSSITAGLDDLGGAVVFTGGSAATLNLPAVASVPPGAGLLVCNSGTANLTIDPNGSELVSGAATLVLPPGEGYELLRVGSGWEAPGARYRAAIAAGAAPVPIASAGLGQWGIIASGAGNPATLPAGGTWAYFAIRLFESGALDGNNAAGVAAGGTTVGAGLAGRAWTGFCWRIA